MFFILWAEYQIFDLRVCSKLIAQIAGQHSYNLRSASNPSTPAQETFADNETERNAHPAKTAADEVDEIMEVDTENMQVESTQNRDNEGQGKCANQESGSAKELASGESTEETRNKDEALNTDPGIQFHAHGDVEVILDKPSDPEDARNLNPSTWAECQALSDAISPTALQYVGITGNIWDMSDTYANYFGKWNFYQERMNTYWAASGMMSVPPKLVSLDRWTGGIENWKTARTLNSGMDWLGKSCAWRRSLILAREFLGLWMP